MTTSSDG